jgi:UDP-N-acetylglucosamine--N-acetylmuramyl-(pentapeptide) pyrophosphoryl-undecaprenol N-acetylglucosamine transferase
MAKKVLLKTENPRIIISGGGTGGHVFPAIAIANEIKKLKPNAEILFVGAEGKIEMEKVPKAGYPIEGLWISGFHRQLTLRNLMFPIKLISSLWKANRIINRFKPNAVVGVGGYASGPTLEIASRKGIPILVQEQNSFPGVTNRLLAKRVSKICVAYDGMDRWFPKSKIVLTGNPVRQDLFKNLDEKREEAYEYFGFDKNKKTIFVFGGSLGARTINDAMAANTELINNSEIQVLWQAGKLYIEEMSQSETAALDNVKVVQFIDRMDLAYAMSDVIIGRAGALTISELCLVGKPSILIPSPNVSEDHQTKNAMALVEKNAAILVKDSEAKELIMKKALEVLNDEIVKENLSSNILKLSKENAAEEIANVVLSLTE